MKTIKTINNLGMVNLTDFEILENYFSACVNVNIDDILPEIRKQIDKSMSNAIDEYNKNFNGIWGNAEPVIDWVGLMLNFEQSGLNYYLSVSLHSAENMLHEDNITLDIELSKQDLNKLKKLVLKTAIDKFF